MLTHTTLYTTTYLTADYKQMTTSYHSPSSKISP